MTPSMQNASYWVGGDVPWISSGDVKVAHLTETSYSVTTEAVTQGRTTLIPARSIVLVVRSGILRKFLPVAMTMVPMAINQDIKALAPFPGYDADFLLHALIGAGPKILGSCLKSGTTVESIELSWLKAFALPLPPTEAEQRAIAAALSDVDALLAGLDRLIAKKRDLKHAAMQQLLTGRTRLPGFRGDWEITSLGAHGVTYGGLVAKRKEDFGAGDARYVTFMNVMSNVVVDSAALGRVYVSPSESQTLLRRGDLLFNGSSETPEEVAFCSVLLEDVPELYLNSFCFGYRPHARSGVDPLFVAYLFRSQVGREMVKSLAQGSTRYNISKGALMGARVALPHLTEQLAISSLLSDMDAELVALEARRVKTRAIKQAMMQVLLTGRVRLV